MSQLDLKIIWVDLKIIPKDLKHFAKRINTDFIPGQSCKEEGFFPAIRKEEGLLDSRPSFTDRVLRLLPETSGDRSRMTARTVDDVSGAAV